MVERDSEYIVSKPVAGGKSATFRVVEDHAGGRLFLWLEPAMNPDEIVAFYRITEQGVAPIESWQNFQQGDAIAPYAGETGASLGATAVSCLLHSYALRPSRLTSKHETCPKEYG